MVLYGFIWFNLVLYGVTWFNMMVYHGFIWFSYGYSWDTTGITMTEYHGILVDPPVSSWPWGCLEPPAGDHPDMENFPTGNHFNFPLIWTIWVWIHNFSIIFHNKGKPWIFPLLKLVWKPELFQHNNHPWNKSHSDFWQTDLFWLSVKFIPLLSHENFPVERFVPSTIYFFYTYQFFCLVGGFNPSEKY